MELIMPGKWVRITETTSLPSRLIGAVALVQGYDEDSNMYEIFTNDMETLSVAPVEIELLR